MDEQIEVTHPDWCLSDDCALDADGSITHTHVQAVVSGMARILIKQVDTRDEDGKLRPGEPKVFTEFPQGASLPNAVMRRVNRWQAKTALFTGESNRTGGVL